MDGVNFLHVVQRSCIRQTCCKRCSQFENMHKNPWSQQRKSFAWTSGLQGRWDYLEATSLTKMAWANGMSHAPCMIIKQLGLNQVHSSLAFRQRAGGRQVEHSLFDHCSDIKLCLMLQTYLDDDGIDVEDFHTFEAGFHGMTRNEIRAQEAILEEVADKGRSKSEQWMFVLQRL